MKSRPLGVQSILATDHNTRRDDARGGSFLLPHQQLGALAMPTNPTNGQTLTVTVNGTAIVITYVSAIGSAANNILIQSTAALTDLATVNFLRRPDITNANQVAASVPNQALLVYLGWSLPSGATTLTPFSLNKNVNGASANLTSFTASTTVTGASWAAQTMQLYVEDGTYYVGTTRVLFAGGSTPTATAPSSNPRIDVLSINSSGVLSWTTGTESASPVAPAYPAGVIVICELYNVVGETALYDNENQQSGEGYIYNDIRPVLGGTFISSTSQVASGLFIVDPGSEVQGNILYYNGSNWVLLAPSTSGFTLQTQGASANPKWALASPSATVRDTSQPNITPNADNAYHTIATYSSIPAITANQTIWIRLTVTSADGHSATTNKAIRITMNGTTVATVSSSSATSPLGVYSFDIFLTVPTPSSTQYLTGSSSLLGTFFAVSGSASANLSSAFSMTVDALANNGSIAMSGPWTITDLVMIVFN